MKKLILIFAVLVSVTISGQNLIVNPYRFSAVNCDTVNDSSLKAYWKMDEASGNATDSKGSNTLTDNNSVGTDTGKVGTSRLFSSASGRYFNIADNADLSAGDVDFSISVWARFSATLSGGQYPTIVAKWETGQKEYILYLNGDSQRIEFAVSNDGSATDTVVANNAGDPTDATWHHIVAWHDATANTINVQVDGGTPDTGPHSTGVFDGTGDFKIGSFGGGFYWTGQIDEVLVTKRVLTAGERTALGTPCRPSTL